MAISLDAVIGTLSYNLREDFGIPHVGMRLWTLDGQRAEASPVSDELKQYAASLSQPFCGPSGNAEAASWFGDAAAHVRSVALVPLRESGVAGAEGACIGMLALGSEDVLRFYPDMGTIHLKRVGELVSSALARFGYDPDAPLDKAIAAFQRHFRPKTLDGVWDDECARLLHGLLEKFTRPAL